MPIFFKLLRWSSKAALSALFWAAVFALSHNLGWFPEEQIAGLFMTAPTPAQLQVVFLGLVALLAIALLFAERWISPLMARIITRIIKGKSPLEIIFDTANPAMRFWERMSPRDKEGNIFPGFV